MIGYKMYRKGNQKSEHKVSDAQSAIAKIKWPAFNKPMLTGRQACGSWLPPDFLSGAGGARQTSQSGKTGLPQILGQALFLKNIWLLQNKAECNIAQIRVAFVSKGLSQPIFSFKIEQGGGRRKDHQN